MEFELFWSYRKWFSGDAALGREIMANIAMFIPFGLLMSALWPSRFSGKVRAIIVVSAAMIFSLFIETLQLFRMRGLFEWDDLVSNTGGALIGVAVYDLLEKLLKEEQLSSVTHAGGALFALICLYVCIRGGVTIRLEADATSREYCFQVDEMTFDNGMVYFSGFSFRYKNPNGEPMLTLRSKEDKVKLNTNYGLPRSDVNGYFLYDRDYTNCGFTAMGKIEVDTEYEIFIRWPWLSDVSTGVFISSSGIHYESEEKFIAPKVSDAPGLMGIVEEGTLRVYRPDFHCWVYQKGWNLYWIVDTDFNFEENGSTYIQYQMWTTQTNKLPEKRLENNWLWDNIGGDFEKYELHGDFGAYRVMKREIPTDYSVTSIVTGYYKDEKWIWQNYFRPIYSFSGGNEP